MCKSILTVGGFALIACLFTGCSGPERKLGRGVRNATEFARLGEIRRTMEQTMLYEGNEKAYTTGVIHGFNRSVTRTLVGAYEIVTFPIPTYDPILKPGNKYFPDMSEDPAYPDSYTSGTLADPTFETDSTLGFNGGDIAPFIPGSRFRIFDY